MADDFLATTGSIYLICYRFQERVEQTKQKAIVVASSAANAIMALDCYWSHEPYEDVIEVTDVTMLHDGESIYVDPKVL